MPIYKQNLKRFAQGLLRRAAWAGFLVMALLALLLAQAPATWLDHGLHRLSQHRLTLAHATGSLWQGRGHLQLLLADGAWLTLTPLQWAWQPEQLLRGALGFRFADSENRTLLETRIDRRGLEIASLSLDLPALALGTASETLRGAQLGGTLRLEAQALHIRPESVEGKARIIWTQAQSGWAPGMLLGDYTLQIEGRGHNLALALTTFSGAATPLALSGNGQWQPGRLPQLAITAQPHPNSHARLEPLLRTLGRRTGEGAYLIRLDQHAGVAGGQ